MEILATKFLSVDTLGKGYPSLFFLKKKNKGSLSIIASLLHRLELKEASPKKLYLLDFILS